MIQTQKVFLWRIFVKDQNGVIPEYIVVLLDKNRAHRITDSKAHEDQRGATGYPENCHQHSLFIAENIAGCNLVIKRQTTPQRCKTFQKDTVSASRSFRPEQLRDIILERIAGCQKSDKPCA
ncbi:hypothetical protein SDC9_138983 [bioreactor metagenome]|uniref:Uncharacterized protein n=1 Tax=bioreactor metagenome TaxID=1076179 RepID=A0A645DRG6_9ZZZZ